MDIPVICDRCRATGSAGSGDFTALGDLLEFTPVKIRPKVNGWDAEAQRAFIALLAATGSKRRAALSIGRNAYGIDQLLKRPDSASFRLAYDRALAIAEQQGSFKIAQGVADAAARNARLIPPSRLRGLPAPDPDDAIEMSDETKLSVFESIFAKFVRSVEQERAARVDGRIVEADFKLRQVTGLEIALDMISHGFGWDTWEMIRSFHRDGHGLMNIAETEISRMLDEARRAVWEAAGDPPRPEHPPRAYLEQHDGYSLEPTEFLWGGSKAEQDAQIAERDRRHREDAAAQIAFEAEARRDYETRRDSATDS